MLLDATIKSAVNQTNKGLSRGGLAIVEEVQAKREPVVITKYGKPMARLEPMIDDEETDPIFGFFKGVMEIVGDIESPIPASEWRRCK